MCSRQEKEKNIWMTFCGKFFFFSAFDTVTNLAKKLCKTYHILVDGNACGIFRSGSLCKVWSLVLLVAEVRLGCAGIFPSQGFHKHTVSVSEEVCVCFSFFFPLSWRALHFSTSTFSKTSPSRGKNGTEGSGLFEKLYFPPGALKLGSLSLLACSFSHRLLFYNGGDQCREPSLP